MSAKLCLHAGGKQLDYDELAKLPAPERMSETHYPIPHIDLVQRTVRQIDGLGIKIASQQHAVSHEGNRYFGVFDLANGNGNSQDGYGLIVGLRNSHDQSLQASLSIGSHVFVCDNLAFSGEVVIARKHTRNIRRDLPGLMARAVNQIMEQRHSMKDRIGAYQNQPIDDVRAHDIVIRAIDAQVIGPPKLALVLEQWRKPAYEEFGTRTAWSLFNAFTTTLKGYHADGMYTRSRALHGLFDAVCGLN